jgi:hypothetical protein
VTNQPYYVWSWFSYGDPSIDWANKSWDGNNSSVFVYAGNDVSNSLVLNGFNAGSLDDWTFVNSPYFWLGQGDDQATFNSNGNLSPLYSYTGNNWSSVDGASGTDRLVGNENSNQLQFDNPAGYAWETGIPYNYSTLGWFDNTKFSNFEEFDLAGGNDLAVVPGGVEHLFDGLVEGGDGFNTLQILGDSSFSTYDPVSSSINVAGIAFRNFSNVIDGNGDQVSLPGFNGANMLFGDDGSNDVDITGVGSGTIEGSLFSSISAINLKGGDDTATIDIAGSVTSLIGGSGSDFLNLNSNNNAVTITGSGAGSSNGTTFSGFETLKTLAGDDMVALSNSAGSTAALALDAGEGNDTLVANASNNFLTLTGVNQGTLDQVSFSDVENVWLGDGDDSVVIQAGGQLTGVLDGGGGNNTLTAPDGSPITIGGGGVSIGGTTYTGFGSVSGGGSGGTNSVQTNDQSNTVSITGAGSGIVDGTVFTSIQSIDLKGGNDSATIGTTGSLVGLLNGGSGTDTFNLNTGNNAFSIKGDGTGTANGTGTGTANATSISSFEEVYLLGGDDTATIDLLNPATAARSLLLNGGDGNDALDIKLTDQEFAELDDTDALLQLGAYLEDPTGKTLDIAFGDFTLSVSGFESATFNHSIPTDDDKPPATPTLTSVAAFSSDTASASGLEGLNLDVGGAANVQAPVTLKSTSDATTVDGNVKSDAHATEVLGISDSTLHSASDLSVGSALKSIVTGTAESTSGIAIANALVDTQHGIDLTDTPTLDALASGGSSTVTSTSTLTATSTAQTVGDGNSDSGPLRLDGAWANTIAEDHLGLGSTGTLTLDSESDATVTTSMVSNLSSTATANDGLAVATAQLLSSTGIENLNAEVGGLGLVTATNQGVFKADATSTTDDASAMSINKASAGILDSSFSFGITDSTITAKDLNSLQVSATSTGGDAWSKLQSSSTGIADLSGIENRITDAGSISAIASDQGFANSATVSGSSSAFASQEAIGISGYDVYNHSGLTLNAQALVTSESNSSAVGG